MADHRTQHTFASTGGLETGHSIYCSYCGTYIQPHNANCPSCGKHVPGRSATSTAVPVGIATSASTPTQTFHDATQKAKQFQQQLPQIGRDVQLPAIFGIVFGSVIALVGMLLLIAAGLGFVGLTNTIEPDPLATGARGVLVVAGVLGFVLLLFGSRMRRAAKRRRTSR